MKTTFWGVMLVVLSFFTLGNYAWAEEETSFDVLLGDLVTSSFKKKTKAVEKITQSSDERVLPILEAMLDGVLYYQKSDKQIVFAEKTENGFSITGALDNQLIGEVGKRDVKKISTNNKLRKLLRTQIAGFKLQHSKTAIRLTAAKDLIKTPSPEFSDVLATAIEKEKDPEVKKALLVAQAVIHIDSENLEERISAVKAMGGYANKHTMAMLQAKVTPNDDGSFNEASVVVREEAEAVLKGLKAQETWYKFVEDLFFGLSLGSVLLLAAVGLAITFGVMGVINMAHGEMIMLGAYTTYVIQLIMPNHIGASLIVAIPAAFLVSGLMGVVIERTVIRHLYGRPLETLLATFGISLILQQLVRSVFSPLNRSVITPDWLSGSWEINGFLSLTYNRLYIIIFALMVLFGLMLLLKKSFFGLQMRAVTQNRSMASSMGIRTGWVDALTFGLGSGIAGIAGVALSQLTNVGPNLGQSYIIDSFLVVVFGGVGNLWGTFVAAMSLGIANKFVEPLAGAVLAKILILIFIILFIQRRPRGLFALKGRFVEG